MKSFVLSQDCWRWRLVDRIGEDDETELAASEGCYQERDVALEDIEKLKAEHPDADIAVERTIVERTRLGAGGESTEEAYQRGYAAAKAEIQKLLGGGA